MTPNRRKLVRRAALIVPALLLLILAVSREARFVLHAAWQEARILANRQPLDVVLADPRLTSARRAQLEWVRQARDFAAQVGLDAGDTYTTFSEVGDGPLLWVVSASPRDQLQAHLWWYPVVGAVPYKGFFEEASARREAERLEARGLDTYVRTASAFSTLGWFPDPLLSTALSDDPVTLVSTVLHEISHNSLWVPDHVGFNESYAQLIGLRGAELFFVVHGEPELAARAAAWWRDEQRLADFYDRLATRLQALYAAVPAPADLDASRRQVFDAARAQLAGPLAADLELYDGARLAAQPLNDASVVANRIYRQRLDLFDRLWTAHGGQPEAVVEVIRQGLDSIEPGTDVENEPFAALQQGLAPEPPRVESGGPPIELPPHR